MFNILASSLTSVLVYDNTQKTKFVIAVGIVAVILQSSICENSTLCEINRVKIQLCNTETYFKCMKVIY